MKDAALSTSISIQHWDAGFFHVSFLCSSLTSSASPSLDMAFEICP